MWYRACLMDSSYVIGQLHVFHWMFIEMIFMTSLKCVSCVLNETLKQIMTFFLISF